MSHEALILYGFNVEMKLMIFIVFSLQTSLVSCQMRYVRHLVVVGCFKEGPDFDAKYIVNQWKSMTMTHEECLLKCKNGTYGPYIGLHRKASRNDATCLCTKGYGGSGPSNKCQLPCPGNRNQICGGKNSVTYLHTFRVAPNAFPDCSSQFSATVYLMLATTVVLIGGTGFAANKTYSAHPASKVVCPMLDTLRWVVSGLSRGLGCKAKSNKQDKQLKPTTAKNKKSPPEKPASAKATKSAKSKAKAKAGKK